MQGRRGSVLLEVRAQAKAIEVQTTLYWFSMDSGSTHCGKSILQYVVTEGTSGDEQECIYFVVLNKEGVKNLVTHQISLRNGLLISVHEATIDLVVWA